MDSMSVCGSAYVYTSRLDSVSAGELLRSGSLCGSVGKSSSVLLVRQTSLELFKASKKETSGMQC